jgi:hypothetical protein
LGFVGYGLSALVYAAAPTGDDEALAQEVLAREILWLTERLRYWQARAPEIEGPWAPFLLRENLPNKEKLLRLMNETQQRR